jgi:hypothetical protein
MENQYEEDPNTAAAAAAAGNKAGKEPNEVKAPNPIFRIRQPGY